MKIRTLTISIMIFLIPLSKTLIAQSGPENLVFEGAGIRGIAYCGALMELDKRGMLAGVKRIAGTSSGAITACLVSVGYTPDEIYKIIGETDFGKFNDGKMGFIGGIYRTKKNLGWYKGDRFLQWLKELIKARTGDAEITFSQLAERASKDNHFKELLVAATSLNHQQTMLFEKSRFPDMRIADAVRASMAVPLYFEPVVIDEQGHTVEYNKMKKSDHICVDGGFTANFCIQAFDAPGSLQAASTLGLRIDSDEQIANDRGTKSLAYQHIFSPVDFIKALYYITKETMNRQTLTEHDWNRTISISDSDIGPKVKKLSAGEKEKLIAAGKQGVVEYFGNR